MNGFKLVGSIVAASWIVQAVSWQSPSSSTETRSDFAYCRVVLDKLSAQQADELRDLAQLWGLHHRRRDDAEAFISVNKHPRPEAHFVKAYATHKSLEQLEAERDGAETLRRSYEKQFQGNVTALLERGVLSPGTPGSRVLECVVARLTPKLYSPRPVVSFVANYYKRPWAIVPYVQELYKCAAVVASELVVNVDNPEEASQWAAQSNATKGWVVPVLSANVHELRGFNRGAQIARGDIIITLQDDEVPVAGANCTWLLDVLRLFESKPKLGILGMRGFVYLENGDITDNHQPNKFVDPVTGLSFSYASVVDNAPTAWRAQTYREISGWDETLGETGECGIVADFDYCLRAWVAGWHVGWAKVANMRHDGHQSGTHSSAASERCWGKQQRVAGNVYRTRWSRSFWRALAEAGRQKNLRELKLVGKCPYKYHADACNPDGPHIP